VRQYTAEYYLPAAAAFAERGTKKATLGVRLAQQRQALAQQWPSLAFGDLQVETRDGQHHFRVEVDFGGVDPEHVLVELYADGPDGQPIRQAMAPGDQLAGRERVFWYSAQVPAERPAQDFTPRLIPRLAGVAVPLEMDLILWQR
jgi:starch phosphorylase